MMHYISTRGGGEPKSFEEVLLAGLAPDGGLYLPERWPELDWQALRGKSYQDIALAVMAPYVEGSIPPDDLQKMIAAAYGPETFRDDDVVPVKHLRDNLYVLEQFYGPTIAFKDVALQLLGRLFDYVLKKRGQRLTIVGATSGDTGSAAIEGCLHSDRLDVFILHPKGRVSDVQRKQMTTVLADNVHNIALEGSFDDCQNMVKAMFGDEGFRSDLKLSAVNSINWARIMAQIVYYVHATLRLSEGGKQEVTYIVPTGNFGNVLAAYCARQMGVPLKLIVATNENDILTRFFESGTMSMAGVVATNTPSMDIEISSNFERYLFELLGRDSAALAQIMSGFKESGSFEIAPDLLHKAREEFGSARASQDEVLGTIKRIYKETGYILDPHTAVGVKAALVQEAASKGALVTLATAHPAKFPDAVEQAIGQRPALPDHLADLFEREERMQTMSNDIKIVQDYVRTHSQAAA